MGRPPAYVFIVRHGNRLDAADKLWHLSSPTPYDPPLTYGGWTQSRAVGQRIGDILRDSVSEDTHPLQPASVNTALGDSGSAHALASKKKKKRRYKVVIHTSPFLRCIQTSISIAAGLASDARPLKSPCPPFSPREAVTFPSPSPAPPAASSVRNKSVLRLDGFLGEWLSPSYFELITPPPSSHIMVATAKAELLRREDYASFVQTSGHTHSNSTGHVATASQLWGGIGSRLSAANSENSPSAALPSPRPMSSHSLLSGAPSPGSPFLRNGGSMRIVGGLDQRWRSGSGSVGANGVSGVHGVTNFNNGGYMAPVPHFALSSKAPAPSGYVAHARDACVLLDYQWDSMQSPNDWGNGGEFGEEWAAMHKRFRKGLQHLVDWYATNEAPTEPVTRSVQFKSHLAATAEKNGEGTDADTGSDLQSADCAIDDDSSVENDDDDYIEESVVILVSHGAGCNAMIGAITQHPVLMDVGLSSLTVAARKPGMEELGSHQDSVGDSAGSNGHASAAGSRKGTSVVHHPNGIVPLNQYYEVELFANTDHLRSPSVSTVSRSNSIASAFGGGGGGGGSGNTSPRGRPGSSLSMALAEVGTADKQSVGSGGSGGRRSPGPSRGPGILGRRVSSGTSQRFTRLPTISTTLNSYGSNGITVGSGVTSFSNTARSASGTVAGTGASTGTTTGTATTGAAAAAGTGPASSTGSTFISSPLGRSGSMKMSVGLWSPVSSRFDEDEDDMEIRLSFGPESPPAPSKGIPAAKQVMRQTDDPMTLDGAKELGPDFSLRFDASGAPSTPPVVDDKQQERFSFTQLRPASPEGLWAAPPPRFTLEPEPTTHDLASTKRRWSANERAL